jgi:hypothetical protein
MATTEVLAHPVSAPPVQKETLPEWTAWERIGFRFAFLFIIQLLAPIRVEWWQRLAGFRSLKEIYSVGMGLGANYITLRSDSGRWGIGSFASWGIAALIALAGAAIWTWFARNSPRKEYNKLNYWLRLAVRYWVAFLAMEYGYYKVFPMQMPFPSISNLHTLFGEHAPYRLYWQAVGIVTWYEVFLGVMEVLAGTLMLFRSTVAVGAIFNMVVMYNVVHGNFAYDGGVHVISGEILIFSGFLFVPYAKEVWQLLVQKKDVVPYTYYPTFKHSWSRYNYYGIRAVAIFVLVPLYFFDTYKGFYDTNRSKEPRSPGIADARGIYNVTEFRLNGKELPYSPLDPVRWHDVVFENYSTLTYKVNHPWPIRLDNQSSMFKETDKKYELAGFAGGRRYFFYIFDESKHLLYLEDKNDLAAGQNSTERRGKKGGAQKPKQEKAAVKLVWHYERPSVDRIVLSGTDDQKNNIYAVLDRIPEQLAINVGSPVQGQPLQYSRPFYNRYPVHDASFDGKQSRWDRPAPKGALAP